jgi:hypothetical protein
VSRSLSKQLFKKVKCHIGGGGGQKSAKKSVTYYLNGPLITKKKLIIDQFIMKIEYNLQIEMKTECTQNMIEMEREGEYKRT